MLINGWSGSGGDAFPFYFREAGLGPLIGTRTWGGLIGITGAPPLVDGGGVTVPTFRMYDPKGDVVPRRPRRGARHRGRRGSDVAGARDGLRSCERAIQEVMERVRAMPPMPGRPAAERRGGGH